MKKRSIPGIRSAADQRLASDRMRRLASNATALGQAWIGSPRPVKTVVWAVTWLVVGGITWLGSNFGLVPNVDQVSDFIRDR